MEASIEVPAGSEPQEQKATPVSNRTRVNGGHEEDLSGHTAWNPSADRQAALSRGDIIGATGLPASEVQPHTLVTVEVNGRPIEMEARSAERIGALRRGPYGYETVQTQANTQQQTQTKMPDPEAEESAARAREDRSQVFRPNKMDDASEATYAKAIEGIHSSFHGRLAEALTMGDGVIPPGLAQEVANSMPGMDAEQVRAKASAALTVLGDQLTTIMTTRHGPTAGDLVNTLREKMPNEFKRAVNVLASQRSVRPFTDLADKYVENLDVYERSKVLRMNQNGWTAKEIDGEVLVFSPEGKSLRWVDALRAGFVRVKGYRGK